MKTALLIITGAMLLSSCVSTSNLFQDGRTVGKNQLGATGSLSVSQLPGSSYDSTNNTVVFENKWIPVPWVQVQLQYGVSDRLDVGGSVGLGVFSMGLQGFAKYSLLPRASRTAISLFVLGGVSGSGVSSSDSAVSFSAEQEETFANFLTALPMSFDVSERSRLVIQPMYAIERFGLRIMRESGNKTIARGHKNYEAYKLGFGFMRQNKHDYWVSYNVCLSYYEETGKVIPTFGIGWGTR